MEVDFQMLINITESVDGKLAQVTSSHDQLQQIQAKIRELEQLETAAEERYDRLESRTQIIDSTTAGVDNKFEALRELEASLATIEREMDPLPNQLE